MKRLIALSVFLLSLALLWANGGPVIEFSSMTLSRTPGALHVPEVQLVNEHLTFTPMGRYTTVEVRYTLRNQTDRCLSNIPYGFPIDYYGSGPCRVVDNSTWEGEYSIDQAVGWSDDYIRDVSFAINGTPLAHRCSADTIIRPRKNVLEYTPRVPLDSLDYGASDSLTTRDLAEIALNEYEDKTAFEYETEISRRWYYAHLTIAPRQEVELVVRYRLFNYGGTFDTYYGDVFRPLDFYNRFSYDFSPAAYWGNGRVGHIDVDVCDRYCATTHWGDAHRYVYPFAEVSPRLLRWSGDDVDLASLEPLTYTFDGYHRSWADYRHQRLSPDQYQVTVSGSVAGYPIANLSDTNAATATVLRPDAKGRTYIRIRLKKPQILAGLAIVGGYAKSQETWTNNCRIKSIGMTAYDEKGNQIKFDGSYNPHTPLWEADMQRLDLPYHKGAARLAEPLDLQRLTREHNCIEIPLSQDLEWLLPHGKMGYPLNATDLSDADYPLGRHKISEIFMEVKEQVPGAKYHDLCVSEIIVLGE